MMRRGVHDVTSVKERRVVLSCLGSFGLKLRDEMTDQPCGVPETLDLRIATDQRSAAGHLKGGTMATIQSFTAEAAKCRIQADEFAGRPEQPFLLRLSEAFDDLASRELLTVSATTSPKKDGNMNPS